MGPLRLAQKPAHQIRAGQTRRAERRKGRGDATNLIYNVAVDGGTRRLVWVLPGGSGFTPESHSSTPITLRAVAAINKSRCSSCPFFPIKCSFHSRGSTDTPRPSFL